MARGFVRRDLLLPLFWPESDGAHARAALRQAIHFLRQSLGEQTLVSRGDDEIKVSEERLWCDAVAFERAISDGRRADALELYGAEFLPGFFIDGAPEFDQWVDNERERLRRRATANAWSLAEECAQAGDHTGAVEFGRAAINLLPTDDALLRKFMLLLEQTDDASGALREYRSYKHRLRVEYDLDPAPEVATLAVEIANRRPAPNHVTLPPCALPARSQHLGNSPRPSPDAFENPVLVMSGCFRGTNAATLAPAADSNSVAKQPRERFVIKLLCLTALLSTSIKTAPDPSAAQLIDRAIIRMGGEATLRGVERIQYDYVTEWKRTTFDERPYMDAGSIEHNTDWRDYNIPAWRNVRRSLGATGWFEFKDIVRDSVGGRFMRSTWMPLNMAYLDERKEIFTYTPDRLMLLARESELKRGADTLIGGMRHARVSGMINGYSSTVFFRLSDGLPAMYRFSANEEADFGLAPWGMHDIEVWYSHWVTAENGMTVPVQWDIKRVGKTYKRISIVATKVNQPIAADSFALPDSTRDKYLTTQRKPMHDVAYDASKLVENDFATFPTLTGHVGAVRFGSGWFLLETGQAPFNAERADEWLTNNGGGKVLGAVVSNIGAGNGGVAWLSSRKLPVYVAPLAKPVVDVVLSSRKLATTGYTVASSGRWLNTEGDSLWVEPIDLPNARGTLFVYSPRLKWLYTYAAGASSLDLRVLLDKAQERKFDVQRYGSVRGIVTAVPASAKN